MMPVSDFEAAVNRLETENRNLVKRLERLEKRQASSILALLANVLLLVSVGLLADYLGLFPPAVNRLPLQAKTVAAEEFVILNGEGAAVARVVVDGRGVQVLDEHGKQLFPRR
jgi:hypothetical protein